MNKDLLTSDSLMAPIKGQVQNSLQAPPVVSYITVEQLKFLKGLPLNNLAWNWLHSLRPTRLVVVGVDSPVEPEPYAWAVTVVTEADDIISGIYQVVAVGVFGVESGAELRKCTNELIKATNS